MFTPLIDAVNRGIEVLKESAPHFTELLGRYVEATEQTANAVTKISEIYERENTPNG